MKTFVYLALSCLIVPTLANAQSQQRTPRILDATTITSGAAITAIAGPANGCNIQSTTDLIINLVGTAGTSATGANQLQSAGGVFQCGAFPSGVNVSVNCSGGGSCTIYGVRW